MPLIKAFPLGLVLTGTTGLTLADGSTHPRLTAWGLASVEGEEQDGLIILEPNSDEVLLGMDFLRKFQKALHVNPITNAVTMVDDTPDHAPDPASPPDDPDKAAHEAVKRLTGD